MYTHVQARVGIPTYFPVYNLGLEQGNLGPDETVDARTAFVNNFRGDHVFLERLPGEDGGE